MRRINLILIAILACALIAGCNGIGKELTIIEGYILEIDDDKMLVAQDVSDEEFIEIEEKFISKDANAVFDGLDGVELIYISYDNLSELKKADKVKTWVDGVEDSYPQQAEAKKVTILN